MVNLAKSKLHQEIALGKVHLELGSVEDMPYESQFFDRIFHCNCYYFWPDMDAAIKELQRVIKPDGKMICVLNHARLQDLQNHNLMQCGDIDPERYMESLRNNGFKDVYMTDIKSKITFQAMYATGKGISD